MERNNIIQSGGFFFIHNFDSGNLGHVERVPTELISPGVNHRTNGSETPEYEFNLWTRPDCAGTEFENGNRTWFYFGVQASEPGVLVRLNLINLNKQGKMYSQGMAPVTRTLPGRPQWERIRDRPIHSTDDNTFTLSFKYRTSDNLKATTFFAFTYPYSFAELQIALNSIDMKMLPLPGSATQDDIYYHRECLIYSLEGRRVDLLTISSHHGITKEREDRLKNLFPQNHERPFKFQNKKIIFISARVHPGETPSSFVFNGFLNLLLNKTDPIAMQLRKLYVFKLIPFLNPDGVARGHYRTDTRGVNLNRVYLNPSLTLHPTVYASRALIRYYHYGCEKEDNCEETKSFLSKSMQNINESTELELKTKKLGRDSSQIKSSRKLNKSSSTVKSSTPGKKSARDVIADETGLTEQVLDMKIQEQPADSEGSTKPSNKPSLLSDDILRTYLGSDVHLSSNEEMNIQGGNPLGSLRDTLTNSISLLMDSNPSTVGDGSSASNKESRLSNVKMGWCRECRHSAALLEHSVPGITALVPGYTQTHDPEASAAEIGDTFFCTNCFKRYIISDSREEIKLGERAQISETVSGGEGTTSRKDSSLDEQDVSSSGGDTTLSPKEKCKPLSKCLSQPQPITKKKQSLPPAAPAPAPAVKQPIKEPLKETDSGLFLYIDLHGHASKKGIFMYGNHFEDVESSVECMLLPRIMSLNNLHFHFSSCNFTERNMYLKDRRDGMSREGSGRVAVLKATGLVRSYTLECNYNTGRLVNVLPPAVQDGPASPPVTSTPPLPPKYTPHIYEERQKVIRAKYLEVFEEKEINPIQVGASLGASILDLTSAHPNSRILCSEHRSVPALRDWLRTHCRSMRPALTSSRLRPKTSSPNRLPLYARAKGKATDERKENTYAGAKTDTEHKRSPPVFAQRSGHDIINLNVKIAKKTEQVTSKLPTRPRYLAENEPKPKSLTSKRRNILAIRKPNTAKAQVGVIAKSKISRRSIDDPETSRGSIGSSKMSKRSYARNIRGAIRAETSRRAIASSSSDDMVNGTWEDVAGGTVLGSQTDSLTIAGKRRPFPAPSPARLKKIRLKTAL